MVRLVAAVVACCAGFASCVAGMVTVCLVVFRAALSPFWLVCGFLEVLRA